MSVEPKSKKEWKQYVEDHNVFTPESKGEDASNSISCPHKYCSPIIDHFHPDGKSRTSLLFDSFISHIQSAHPESIKPDAEQDVEPNGS